MAFFRDPHSFTPNGLRIRNSIVRANGVDHHVVDYGGAGETIVCVHGLSSTARVWDLIAEKLVNRFRVIAFDIRGRGDSARPEDAHYDLWQYAEDTKAIIDCAGVSRPVLMGHSMGASIGVVFTNVYPEYLSRLIMIDGGGDLSPAVREALAPTLSRPGKTYLDFESYVCDRAREWDCDPEIMRYYHWLSVNHHSDGSVTPKVAKHALAPKIPVRPVALNNLRRTITVPALFLWSSRGFITSSGDVPLVTAEDAATIEAQLAPGSLVVEIKGSNHMTIVIGEHAATAQQVRQFLVSNVN